MEVDRQHAVGAGRGDHVGDELCRDRRAGERFPVLPRIAEIGDDGGDAARRGAAERVDDDQQLHQIVVRRKARRLHDEHVLAAHVLLDLDEDLLVGEAPDRALRKLDVEIVGDRLGERAVGVAGDDLHAGKIRAAWPARAGVREGSARLLATAWRRREQRHGRFSLVV